MTILLYNFIDDGGFKTVFYDQFTVPYIITVHDMSEVYEAVGVDGVAMEVLLMEARSWLYAYAYCSTTFLNLGIFPVVLCNLLLFSSLRDLM